MDDWTKIKTNPELLEKLEAAAKKQMTPEEIFEQRVAWVWSLQDFSNGEPPYSKDEIREMLRKKGGHL